MTASKILNLNEGDRFRPETQVRVREAAQRLGYAPNRSAQVMRSQRSGIIGFVSVNFDKTRGVLENHPVQPFLTGMSHELGHKNQHVAIVELTELEPMVSGDLPMALRQRFFDGLVVHFGLSKRARGFLDEFDIPILYWDSGLDEPYNCLIRDEYRATGELTEHMFDLGYQNIVYYVGCLNRSGTSEPCEHFSAKCRVSAFSEVLTRHGKEPILIDGFDDPDQLAEKFQAAGADAIVLGGMPPSAFNLAMTRLAAKGINISYASCDVEARSRFSQGVTGMSYDRYEAGRIAVRMLQSAIESRQHKIPSQQIAAPFVRGSSLAAPARFG